MLVESKGGPSRKRTQGHHWAAKYQPQVEGCIHLGELARKVIFKTTQTKTLQRFLQTFAPEPRNRSSGLRRPLNEQRTCSGPENETKWKTQACAQTDKADHDRFKAAAEYAGDVIMPGALGEHHLVLQVPHEPRQVGGVHVLKGLEVPKRSSVDKAQKQKSHQPPNNCFLERCWDFGHGAGSGIPTPLGQQLPFGQYTWRF